MSRTRRCLLAAGASAAAIALVLILASSIAADVPPDWCITEPGVGDEVHTICVPQQWHGGLVLWAHGTVFPSEPLRSATCTCLAPISPFRRSRADWAMPSLPPVTPRMAMQWSQGLRTPMRSTRSL